MSAPRAAPRPPALQTGPSLASLSARWGHKVTCDCLQGVKIIIRQLTATKRTPLVKCQLAVPARFAGGEQERKPKLNRTMKIQLIT